MSFLKSTLPALVSKASGNRLVQKLLEKNVLISEFLMGIGSGGWVAASGEKGMFTILRRKFPPRYCIFDVGANKGEFLKLAMNSIPENDFTIHCFEPGLEAFRLLSGALPPAINRIKLNNHGLGREPCRRTIYYDYPGSSLASLTKRRLDHFGIDFNKSETVSIDTLDNYCEANLIKRIHLVKIDVEGHELDVLHGSERMFDKQAIELVSFEFGGCNIDTRSFFQDYYYFFSSVKMRICRITPSGYLFPIDSYSEMHERFRTTNFLALRNA